MIKVCEVCGKEFKTFPCRVEKGHSRFCSRKCRGVNDRSEKSLGEVDGFNTYVATSGYAKIVFGRSSEQLLHVYFMEKHLGRKLVKNEHVHHINENKLDNRLENLLLVDNCGEHQKKHAEIRLKALGGDLETEKYCPKCRKVLPRAAFGKSRCNYDGLYGYCKICAAARVTNKRRENSEAVNARRRARYWAKKGAEL